MLWSLHCSLILGGDALEKSFTNFLSRQMAAKMAEMGKKGGGVVFSVKTYLVRRCKF